MENEDCNDNGKKGNVHMQIETPHSEIHKHTLTTRPAFEERNEKVEVDGK